MQTYGYWTIESDKTKGKVLATCICGVKKINRITDIRSGKVKSCGCKKHDAFKQTCLDRYGSEHYYQTDDFKQKSKQTCIARYGIENAGWSQESQIKS